MQSKILLKANLKKHKGSFTGIVILTLIVALSLATVLTVWTNSSAYVQSEMLRLGFGDLTAWVSGVEDIEQLKQDIASIEAVKTAQEQDLIFSQYSIGEAKSDSEGQLITYNPQKYNYKIFTDDLKGYKTQSIDISQGDIYISPSLISMFGLRIGDKIDFPIARNGVQKTFTVKGYFEDAFMGSSMIGMKSFLINGEDSTEIIQTIGEAKENALARQGYMIHMYQNENVNTGELNLLLNQNTALGEYSEFVHSSTSISGFMLTLQNVFTGLLLAFVLILIIVSLIVIGHSISSYIEQDRVNIGILKAVGFTGACLRNVQLMQYILAILCGIGGGIVLALCLCPYISQTTVTTTGMLMPSQIPFGLCALAFGCIAVLLMLFVYIKTRSIDKITPISAIRGYGKETASQNKKIPRIRKKNLSLLLAIRQLFSKKSMYVSACIIGAVLVFFTSLVGRMDFWLGQNGEGMMDAFNPAELDIGIQSVGEVSADEIKDMVLKHSAVTDEYMLAMPSVAINGIDYTANVISQPNRFHILKGRTCVNENEIVLTEFVAADLNVNVGDKVTAAVGANSEEYTVSGIYQCANDMGANIGMSKAGYEKIGKDDPSMWCMHYFLENPMIKEELMNELQSTYGGDVYMHENSWPGLQGILAAMNTMMILMYGIVAVFVLVVTALTGSKVLAFEQKDLGIYKAMGFSTQKLRSTFALRFGITALLGSVVGVVLSGIFTDPLVSALLKSFGISNFSSQPDLINILLPLIAVTGLFLLFAYASSGKIKKIALTELISKQS